ncbi:MAG TPA: NADH-quinone oxidoreductase subunit C [Candidatus Nanopelagicales bacterium]|nr:NADH-quinone oxidoreductase subunit C [Candidatus Nanopelagicales bacterium]
MTSLAEAVAARLPAAVLGAEDGFGPTTVDVAADAWREVLAAARESGAVFFDFLTAYDELEAGFAVVAHVSTADAADHVLWRTRLPREQPALASITGVYRGAGWHERETAEMFGIDFPGHPGLTPLLLPDGFDARPLRKDFVLASRVAKAWPGGKDPADPPGGAPSRRAMAPPGVPADWAKDPQPQEPA